MSRPTTSAVETLRAELARVTSELSNAERTWHALDDDPAAFSQRARLAAEITTLRQRAAELPALIELAQHQAAGLTDLREQHRELAEMAAANLAELIALLPDREAIRSVFQLCAQANFLLGIVAPYDEAPPRPFNAVHDLRAALRKLESDSRLSCTRMTSHPIRSRTKQSCGCCAQCQRRKRRDFIVTRYKGGGL